MRREIALLIIPLMFTIAIVTLDSEAPAMSTLKLSSPSFKQNGMIPAQFTCDGRNVNPALLIEGMPPEARSLALIMDDPDAPRGTWVHWVVWNIDPKTAEIRENSAPSGSRQGMNDFGKSGYGGPCPPSGTHRYFFKLYALNAMLDLAPDAGKAELESALQGHIITQAELIGLYARRK